MDVAVASRLNSEAKLIPEWDRKPAAVRSNPDARIPPRRSLRGRTAHESDQHGMVLLHLPQVHLIARHIWNRLRFAVELDDLIGYGMIGLLNAVERFDPDRGVLLKTYAEHRIRGAILDGLRGMDWLPRSARQKERQSSQASEERETVAVAAPAVPTSPRKAQLRKGSNFCSDAPLPPQMEFVFAGGDIGDLERLAELTKLRHGMRRTGANPENLYERKESYDRLTATVSRLPRRQRQVIELYYHRELSMKQIGAMLGVHESRVSQLHAAAIQRLRKQLGGLASCVRTDCRKPVERYSLAVRGEDSSSRLTAARSSSVSTPMVSCSVSAT